MLERVAALPAWARPIVGAGVGWLIVILPRLIAALVLPSLRSGGGSEVPWLLVFPALLAVGVALGVAAGFVASRISGSRLGPRLLVALLVVQETIVPMVAGAEGEGAVPWSLGAGLHLLGNVAWLAISILFIAAVVMFGARLERRRGVAR